ncbi:MAG: hypothetical protein GY861_02765 [bacterium]|nr:hypothetical protein [bacterium]
MRIFICICVVLFTVTTADAFSVIPKLQEKVEFVAPDEGCRADGSRANQATKIGINYNDVWELLICEGDKPELADVLAVTDQELSNVKKDKRKENQLKSKAFRALIKTLAPKFEMTTKELWDEIKSNMN